MKPPESFATPRLFLRIPSLDDAEIIFQKYAQDAEATKYLSWQPHKNLDTTREFLHRCIQCWKEETAFPWTIIRKNDNALLGMIEIRIDRFRADFGYVLAREYWRNGYATESTKSVTQWAIEQESIYRVWAVCDVENLASKRVMEKAGMQKEGVLRRFIIRPGLSSEPRDCYSYSLVK